MAVVSVAGAAFTVTLAAVDYSEQVMSGSISTEPNIVRSVTLGGVAFDQTDLNSSVSLDFLYDEDSGMYDALQTAIAAGTSVALVIASTSGTWTGSAMYVDSCDLSVAATDVASVSAGFTGTVTFA